MKKIIFVLSIISLSFSALAISPSTEHTFCSDRKNIGFVQELITDNSNTIAFRNQGGLANGGVCWWHSRLTRNAAYLAYFTPGGVKPQNKEEVKEILRKLRKGKAPVEISGFSNFYFFTRQYPRIVQKFLNHWQRESGIINQSWIKGVSGNAVRKPEKLKKEMDKTFADIQAGKIVYHKLQIKGIVAHAWLVSGMVQTGNGYILTVLDSNYSRAQTYRYTYGDTHMYHRQYGKFSPYREKKKEEKKLRKTINEYCK